MEEKLLKRNSIENSLFFEINPLFNVSQNDLSQTQKLDFQFF